MHGVGGGPVHAHSVQLVEMFYRLVIELQKNVILNFLVFQPKHMVWVLKRTV